MRALRGASRVRGVGWWGGGMDLDDVHVWGGHRPRAGACHPRVNVMAVAAGEIQITEIKALAGTWQGWVTYQFGQKRALMIVKEDGSYEASTTRGAQAIGKFYLRDGTPIVNEYGNRDSLGRQRPDITKLGYKYA